MSPLFKKMLLAVFYGRGIMAVRQLILVPVLIYAWGIEYYGEWVVLTAIPTFLSMSNLGIGTSANFEITKYVRAGSVDKAIKVFATSQWMILLIAIVTLLVTAVVMQYFYTDVSSMKIKNPILIVILMMGSIFIQMLATPLLGWWTGHEIPAKGYQYLNYFSLLSLFLTIVVPVAGGGAVLLCVVLFLGSLAWIVLFSMKTYFQFNWKMFYYYFDNFSIENLKNILKVGLGHQLSPLWQAIFFQGSLVLAGSLLGASGAALWGALRILCRSGNQLLELISQSLSPEFVLNWADGNLEKLKKLHAMGVCISIFLSIGVAIGLINFGPWFFNYWTHSVFVVPRAVWWIMAISLIPFSIWWVSSELQRSINRPWALNIYATFAAIVSVLFMFVFDEFGIIGFSMGSFVFDFLMMLFVLPLTLKILKCGIFDFVFDILKFIKNIFHVIKFG
jgi:O-antigen/teichoic acid export membrane protein